MLYYLTLSIRCLAPLSVCMAFISKLAAQNGLAWKSRSKDSGDGGRGEGGGDGVERVGGGGEVKEQAMTFRNSLFHCAAV